MRVECCGLWAVAVAGLVGWRCAITAADERIRIPARGLQRVSVRAGLPIASVDAILTSGPLLALRSSRAGGSGFALRPGRPGYSVRARRTGLADTIGSVAAVGAVLAG